MTRRSLGSVWPYERKPRLRSASLGLKSSKQTCLIASCASRSVASISVMRWLKWSSMRARGRPASTSA